MPSAGVYNSAPGTVTDKKLEHHTRLVPSSRRFSSRYSEIPVQERPREQRQVHGQGPLEPVEAPQLPRGDGSVVGDTGGRPSYPKVV